MNKNNYLAIMAGGIGSRFWPASSEEKPKQFLDITGCGKSLLRQTFERFENLFLPQNIYIVTNYNYNNLVKEEIPEISPDNIINEPSRNNTAPSVAYTSFKILSSNPEANIVIAPSDHVILKEDLFRKKICDALQFSAENNVIVTLGIKPDRPDTGYGYIEMDLQALDEEKELYKVASFREKPDLITSKRYVESNKYLWNAGIFIFKAKTMIHDFQIYATDIYDLFIKGESKYNTKLEVDFINENYPKSRNISIDYAVMENADNIYTIVSDINWSDLGTWNSLHAFIEKDDQLNVSINADTTFINSKNNIISANNNKKIIVKDLQGYIIVDVGDTLMIYPKHKEQEIKHLQK